MSKPNMVYWKQENFTFYCFTISLECWEKTRGVRKALALGSWLNLSFALAKPRVGYHVRNLGVWWFRRKVVTLQVESRYTTDGEWFRYKLVLLNLQNNSEMISRILSIVSETYPKYSCFWSVSKLPWLDASYSTLYPWSISYCRHLYSLLSLC